MNYKILKSLAIGVLGSALITAPYVCNGCADYKGGTAAAAEISQRDTEKIMQATIETLIEAE